MRDLIISCPPFFTEDEKTAILDYCLSDTEHLPTLLSAINEMYKKFIPRQHRETLLQEIHWRAEYSVRTAMMVRHGYPVEMNWLKNLTENIYNAKNHFPNLKNGLPIRRTDDSDEISPFDKYHILRF
jgi:hypothetical protein